METDILLKISTFILGVLFIRSIISNIDFLTNKTEELKDKMEIKIKKLEEEIKRLE